MQAFWLVKLILISNFTIQVCCPSGRIWITFIWFYSERTQFKLTVSISGKFQHFYLQARLFYCQFKVNFPFPSIAAEVGTCRITAFKIRRSTWLKGMLLFMLGNKNWANLFSFNNTTMIWGDKELAVVSNQVLV